MVFDERWFKQNQWWLLPYVSHDRDNLFIGTNKPLVEIAPDHVSWLEEPGLITTEFHVHHVYGRRLYQRLSPLWNLMHRIDMSTWARQAGFNLGFDTLTAYPDAHTESETVDGFVNNVVANSTWSSLHDAVTGTGVSDSSSANATCVQISAGSTTDRWTVIKRGFFLFKTSTLGGGASVSAATLSISGDASSFPRADNFHIVASAPASNTALVVEDFDTLGNTSFGSVASSAWSTSAYNDISLNESGLANIAKTGISKFGTVSGYDVANSPPSWAKSVAHFFGCVYADNTGSFDPKLVVTYSAAATFIPKCIFL